jgi:hypothetical protein
MKGLEPSSFAMASRAGHAGPANAGEWRGSERVVAGSCGRLLPGALPSGGTRTDACWQVVKGATSEHALSALASFGFSFGGDPDGGGSDDDGGHLFEAAFALALREVPRHVGYGFERLERGHTGRSRMAPRQGSGCEHATPPYVEERDTGQAMSEESTTPDLLKLTRAMAAAQGVEASMRFVGPDAVYDMSPIGLGTFRGQEDIRRFFTDWYGSYAEAHDEIHELVDLGNGVVFATIRETAQPSGSPASSQVHGYQAVVMVWEGNRVAKVTAYLDIEGARAAAERLAAERDR